MLLKLSKTVLQKLLRKSSFFRMSIIGVKIVYVGEGRMDQQSLAGKAPIGVARRTPRNVPVIAICGSLSDDLPYFPAENIQAAFPIISQVEPLAITLAKAEENLIRTAQNIGNLLKMKI